MDDRHTPRVGCSKLLALPGPGNTVAVVEAQTGTVVSHQPQHDAK